MKPLLDVTHLSISYGSLTAVNDLSFSLNAGSTLAIVGESGSGKSSVLRAILGLPERGRSWQGDISMDGQSLLTLPPGKRRALCGSAIAMIFQDAGASFCPVRRISAQISESIRAHANWTKQQIRQRAEELMAVLDLPQTVWDAYPFELSGGMGQRVGILAAMMLRPKLLLADEPTSALDVLSLICVLDALKALQRTEGTAILLVTHNIAVARHLADALLVMRRGECIEYGTCETVLQHPQQAYTRELLHAIPQLPLEGTAEGGLLQ